MDKSNKIINMEYFETIKDLQDYSNIRFSIRYNNSKIHRLKKGSLNNAIAIHKKESLYKDKSEESKNILNREREFRDIIKSLRLPVTTKIL